jgi:hypothetical protein
MRYPHEAVSTARRCQLKRGVAAGRSRPIFTFLQDTARQGADPRTWLTEGGHR